MTSVMRSQLDIDDALSLPKLPKSRQGGFAREREAASVKRRVSAVETTFGASRQPTFQMNRQ